MEKNSKEYKKNRDLLLDVIGFCFDIYNGKYDTKKEFEDAMVERLQGLRKTLGL